MFLESLESRTLLSVSVSPVSLQVTLDRAQVHADLLQFQTDIAANTTTLLADCQTLKSDKLKNDATLEPMLKTLSNDVTSMPEPVGRRPIERKQRGAGRPDGDRGGPQ